MTELRLDIVYCYHCGERHVDDGEYAEKNHSMHRCEHCRRFFYTASNVGVKHKPLVIDSTQHPGGVAVWPATAPIFDTRKTRNRGSEHGFHVHAYGEKGTKTIDGTWDCVTVDGECIAPDWACEGCQDDMRTIEVDADAMQCSCGSRATKHWPDGRVTCSACGASLVDPAQGVDA